MVYSVYRWQDSDTYAGWDGIESSALALAVSFWRAWPPEHRAIFSAVKEYDLVDFFVPVALVRSRRPPLARIRARQDLTCWSVRT
jgi:hypothetical protein